MEEVDDDNESDISESIMSTMTPVKNPPTSVTQKAVSTLLKLQGRKRPQTPDYESIGESSDSEGILALQIYNVLT